MRSIAIRISMILMCVLLGAVIIATATVVCYVAARLYTVGLSGEEGMTDYAVAIFNTGFALASFIACAAFWNDTWLIDINKNIVDNPSWINFLEFSAITEVQFLNLIFLAAVVTAIFCYAGFYYIRKMIWYYY